MVVDLDSEYLRAGLGKRKREGSESGTHLAVPLDAVILAVAAPAAQRHLLGDQLHHPLVGGPDADGDLS